MSPMLSRAEILKYQQEGYRAYLKGSTPKACPYSLQTEEEAAKQDAWFRGFAASKTDRARANRAVTPAQRPPTPGENSVGLT
jgi:ribosome modulation factor